MMSSFCKFITPFSTKTLVFLLLVFTQTALFAQWEIGFGLNGMGPVDRFKGSVYQPGMGVFTSLATGSVFGKQNPNKLQLGIYFDHLNAGTKKFDVTLDDPVDGEGRMTFTNKMGAKHFFVRYGYQVNQHAVIFTDFIVGTRRFYSDITTGLKKYEEEYEDDIQHIHSRMTSRHGVGFGVRYGFGRSFGLEVRADYTRGNKSVYFNLNTIKETADAITYENESWAHSDLFVGTLALNWKLYRPNTSPTISTSNTTKKSYYDGYNGSNRSSSSAGGSTTRTNKRTSKQPSPKKKPVKSSKKVEEKKEEKKIDW